MLKAKERNHNAISALIAAFTFFQSCINGDHQIFFKGSDFSSMQQYFLSLRKDFSNECIAVISSMLNDLPRLTLQGPVLQRTFLHTSYRLL